MRHYQRSGSKVELRALLAAQAWLERRAEKPPHAPVDGSLAKQIAGEFGVSRRKLDQAIFDIQQGRAYPSQAFLDARDVAERILGASLTYSQLEGIVQAIRQEEASDVGES